MRLFTCLAACLALAGGCAVVPDVEIPPEHPANPFSPTAPMPAASGILDLANPASPQTQPADANDRDQPMPHHHEGEHP